MDILIGWQPYETQFRGQTVTMELLPLTVSQFRLVLPHMRRIDDKDEAAQNAFDLIGKSLPIFQMHVRNIQGITVNGAPPTAEQIQGEALFIHLAQDIINELFIRSTITEAEEKNSGSPSEASNSESSQPSLSGA